MNFIKNNLLFLFFVVFITTSSFSQTFIQSYANVVNQCSQNNITTNLTEFEALGVKRRGTAALQNTLDWFLTGIPSLFHPCQVPLPEMPLQMDC